MQPISHIRKAIATHMLASVNQTARAWTMVEVNVERLVRLRETAKERFQQTYGVKLTYLPMVTRATVDALHEFPLGQLAAGRRDSIVTPRFVNMGIAVSYDAGLIVPVIKGVDGMNTVGIARAVADLAAQGARPPAAARRGAGRDVHDHEPGPVRLARVGADHQPAERRASCRSTRSRSAPSSWRATRSRCATWSTSRCRGITG